MKNYSFTNVPKPRFDVQSGFLESFFKGDTSDWKIQVAPFDPLDSAPSKWVTSRVGELNRDETPPVPTPTPADDNDPVGLVAARAKFIEQAERARDVLKEAKHRKWAKAVSKYALGGEGVRFSAEMDDTGKLAKIITALKNDFDANGLDLEVFDLSNTAREVHPAVNGVLYDTLAHIVAEEGSAAEMFLEGAGDASERDGRRALIDLAKGCIPVGLMTSHMEEYMAIRYEAKEVDPRKALTLEHRLVKENTTPGWFPDEDSRKQAMVGRLDTEFYRALLDKYPLEADLAKLLLLGCCSELFSKFHFAVLDVQKGGGVLGDDRNSVFRGR
ncbi:hypothetical protein CYMTET_19964 [Cymbomonas tetramitiformis]|uniref:Uncharacterized protein n=1 Tax=Cymbomonas tetramitiformis TaxID=36881 RepID=A0AAE0G530_9CHLO|nr:hypothetical protein CYMTET_19964 [Cymbomonas tetramitiformis]